MLQQCAHHHHKGGVGAGKVKEETGKGRAGSGRELRWRGIKSDPHVEEVHKRRVDDFGGLGGLNCVSMMPYS